MSERAWKILVVDDDPIVLSAVVKLLQRYGYEVSGAATGRECLHQVEVARPDLVLLDIMLPDINGVEVLKQIKANPRYDETFVVHLSAQQGPAGTRLAGLELGADGYITQPVENQELLIRVQAFLRHKSALDALRESETRYRTLFESNPEPMWIYSKENSSMVAVNHAALEKYGFTQPEFLALKPGQLTADVRPGQPLPPAHDPANDNQAVHRRKNGERVEVELQEQDILWLQKPARVVLAHDVTERNRVERERVRQLDRLARELNSLGRLAAAKEGGTVSDSPLRERDSLAYNEIFDRYQHLLSRAMQQRIYKTETDVSEELRRLAGELVRLGATARDLIEIHCHTIKRAAPIPETPKSQALIDTARMNLVELLGYLVTAYRSTSLKPGG